jgi:predicted neutral ceramidase superfamily lipid hydrolase
MTTSFHRNVVKTGYLLIDDDWSWTWHEFDLPQLIRKTVDNVEEMVQTDFHHTIYEIEGDVQDLAKVKNSELLDKKVIKREVEATLNLDNLTIEEELVKYLTEILKIEKTNDIVRVFNDYSKEFSME